MIALIDYNAGNTCSVMNALKRLNADYLLTHDVGLIRQADHVIFPGVGHASAAMQSLKEKQLIPTIQQLQQPMLGICVGMQLMAEHSEEGDTICLGLVPGTVGRFQPEKNDDYRKVPHMGWNTLSDLKGPLFRDIPRDQYVYFVHSYFMDITDHTIGRSSYNHDFTAAIQRDNFYGVQFHTEKSGKIGEQILANFLAL